VGKGDIQASVHILVLSPHLCKLKIILNFNLKYFKMKTFVALCAIALAAVVSNNNNDIS
jgi:hypothetical protein